MTIPDQHIHTIIRSAKIIHKHAVKTCSPDIAVDQNNWNAGFLQFKQAVLCNSIKLGNRRNNHAFQALADCYIQKLVFFAQGLIRSKIYDIIAISVCNLTDSTDGLKKELVFDIWNDNTNTGIIIDA